MNRKLSFLLSLVLILGIIFNFPVTPSAATVDELYFALNKDGESYSVVKYENSIDGDLVIPDTYNGLPVTSISPHCFEDTGLEFAPVCLNTIVIPDSITSIGDRAFYGASVNRIVFSEGVTHIGKDAFYNANINAVCITDMTKWFNIDFENYAANPLHCAVELYLNDELVTELVIPDGIKKIPDGCLSSPEITSVVIPDSVTEIGAYAFSGCTGLTSINIPDSVTDIGDFAFSRCTNLDSVIIPDSVNKIGNSAFNSCKSLNTIVIPDSVTSIGRYAFEGTGYYSNTYNWDKQVLYIGNHLIKADPNLTGAYEIKEGTKTISDYAFHNITTLATITMPDGLTTIGNSAFRGCKGLLSFSIPDSVESIGSYAFSDCQSITSIEIPYGVKQINEATFKFCIKLNSITLPDTITDIGESAFYNCSKLTEIKLPVSVVNIGETVFSGNTKYLFYEGTAEDWAKINIETNLTYLKIHFNSNNHSASEWIIDKDATCTQKGSKHKECTVCDLTLETAIIPATGHTAVKDNAIAATCTTEGKTEGSHCTVCKTVIKAQTTIPAKGHTEVKDESVEATCSSIGKTSGSHCSVCNVVIVEQLDIPAKGHTYSDWIIDKDATCTEAGSKHKECTECEVVLKTEVISATGHTCVKDNAITETCTTSGKTEGSHCSVCNTVIVAQQTVPAKGHTSSDWIVDNAATVSAPGSKHKECTECGEVLKTEVIPQLKPATPKVATTNEINGVNVTWNAVDGAVKYNVYRRQGGSSTWTLVGTTTGTSLTDTKVTSGIYYVYSVRAYNNAGQYSDFVSANTNTRKYMAVPKLASISNATNGLYITWNPVAGVTNGYRVYRRGAGSTYWTYLGTTKNLYFIDSAVKNKSGEYFRYTVIADGDYHSKFDTTGLYLKRLANPALNSAVSSKSGITVKWGAVKGTTGYYVYRKTANSSWVRIAAVGGTNSTAYLDKTARKGTTYTYTVRAVYGATTSAYNSGISCYDKY